MNQINKQPIIQEKIRKIRQDIIKKVKIKSPNNDLNKPVAFWTKNDRLLNEVGNELTIILRTRGCEWALGDNGGCSMCGYISDANIDDVNSQNIINQFDYAFQNSLDKIQNDSRPFIIKIFNSGSFFDSTEIPKAAREYIYGKIAQTKNIKELVIESRPEYINHENLDEIKKFLPNKYIEVGIGLETVNDYIRINYINKGFKYIDFLEAFKKCKDHKIGVKAYLLFKPPFLSEQAAIDDCKKSIKKMLEIKINSISINPANIQKGTLVESLWFQNRYRSPWIYSIITCLKESLQDKGFETTRILCDPSGAGTNRGVHNCFNSDCNKQNLEIIKNFILSQDVNELNYSPQCFCKKRYKLNLLQ